MFSDNFIATTTNIVLYVQFTNLMGIFIPGLFKSIYLPNHNIPGTF